MPADPHAPVAVADVDHAGLFRLDGRRHVVVGAGAGIGEHVARTLSHLGARILCVDLSAELAARVGDSLGAPSLGADATTEEGVAQIAAAVDRELGGLDGYVDVIGRQTRRLLPEFTLDEWTHDFRVNLVHTFLLAQALAPRVARHGGSIVHISSTAAGRAGHRAPGYGPAKAALEMWTRQLAAEYGPAGVRVNAVAPGLFLSERLVANGRDVAVGLSANTPLRRLGQPHEVAATIAFLLTPAAGYISGAVIPVDGGILGVDPSGLDDLLPEG